MTKSDLNIGLLDNESALEAIETVGEIAAANSIDWALVGGIACLLYGSDRLTKEVDIIALSRLPVPRSIVAGQLQQGGERYNIETEKQTVSVDWIIRNDEAKRYFQEALKEVVLIKNLPVLTHEWLVILKHIAGRFKDQEDAIFLLRQKGLVDRKKIKENIIRVGGQDAWGLAKSGYQRWYDLADGKTESRDPDLIDS
jgi:hypothetical protein